MWSKIVAWASTNITARNVTFHFFWCNQSCIHNILSTMNTMSPYGAITLSPLTHLSSCRITSLWFCRLTAIVSYQHRWFSYSMFTYTYVCLHILISDTHILCSLILYVYLYLRFTNIVSYRHLPFYTDISEVNTQVLCFTCLAGIVSCWWDKDAKVVIVWNVIRGFQRQAVVALLVVFCKKALYCDEKWRLSRTLLALCSARLKA